MKITEGVKYLGVTDRSTDLFEGQYLIPNGISYNSYAVIDEKIAIMDTVESTFADEWFENIAKALGDRSPDYLVVHHMEPDHSAVIAEFARRFPCAAIVSSAAAFKMMKNFFGTDFSDRRTVVGEGDVPVLQCLRILEAHGYDNYITVEFEGMEEAKKGVACGLKTLKAYAELV